jgi:hypothetical protein
MKLLISNLISTVIASFAIVPKVVANSAAIGIGSDKRPDAAVGGDFATVVISFINYFLLFLGLLVVTVIIYAGVLLVTAQGSEEQINKAKSIILYAVIGMIIIMLSYSIVALVAGAADMTPA